MHHIGLMSKKGHVAAFKPATVTDYVTFPQEQLFHHGYEGLRLDSDLVRYVITDQQARLVAANAHEKHKLRIILPSHGKDELVLVLQTRQQLEAYCRYGRNGIFIDATHKASK